MSHMTQSLVQSHAYLNKEEDLAGFNTAFIGYNKTTGEVIHLQKNCMFYKEYIRQDKKTIVPFTAKEDAIAIAHISYFSQCDLLFLL